MWDLGSWGGNALRGCLSKGSYPVFRRAFEKTTENSERLGRKARSGIEHGTIRLLDLRAEPLGLWWGLFYREVISTKS